MNFTTPVKFTTRIFTWLLALAVVGWPFIQAAQSTDGYPDELAKPTEEVTYHQDGNVWTRSSRVLWTYDRTGDGEATRALTQSWQDGEWYDVSKEEGTLDAEGRQVTGMMYEWANAAWSERIEMTFFFHAPDQVGPSGVRLREHDARS